MTARIEVSVTSGCDSLSLLSTAHESCHEAQNCSLQLLPAPSQSLAGNLHWKASEAWTESLTQYQASTKLAVCGLA